MRAAPFALVLLLGCVGTETGNPPLTAELTVDAHSSEPERVAIRADAAQAVIDEAWIALGAPTFAGDADCAMPDVPPQLEPLGTRDHAGSDFLQRSFDLTEREVCLVEVPLAVGVGPIPSGAPAELATASIVLLGRRADGAPFRVVYEGDATVRLSPVDETFEIAGDGAGLFLGFDVATWLDGVALDVAEVGADGTVIIDPAENVDLHRAFEANLARGVELYRDDDLNGMPDGAALARGD